MDSSAPATLFNRDNFTLETQPPKIIPIVDFSSYVVDSLPDSESKLSTKQIQTANNLINAFATSGFVYLTNHGVPQDVIDDMFALSRDFFGKSVEEKEKIVWDSVESNRGYVSLGKEKLSDLDKEGRGDEIKILNEISPDLKEAFDLGLDDPTSPYQNKYPSPASKPQLDSFFERMRGMHEKMMTAIAVGLGLTPTFFHPFIQRGGNTLRLLHYPPVLPTQITDTSRRCGAHTDYGSVTFLFQDNVGGLEVLDNESGAFVRAVPVPGTILVNVGDILQRWTNDYLKSNQHRVVKPYSVGSDGMLPARYSIAYFCDPDSDALVETVGKFVTDENPNKYQPVNAGEYLRARLSNTYI
ncbi:hypothetical protein HDU79_011797 [Rhizoclosmatium sp. JEL0117]|nr:hypothetical protein HDU79_011797 [Rhizoclosmatium sp. JEL0117]